MQREEVVRIRVVEGAQSEAGGMQRGGGQRHARHVPPVNWWPINQTSDAGHSQREFSAGGQNDVPAHLAASGPGRPGSGRRGGVAGLGCRA